MIDALIWQELFNIQVLIVASELHRLGATDTEEYKKNLLSVSDLLKQVGNKAAGG